MSASVKTYPRWPLLIIAAPAAVAVFSGWVGLGQMCGFGIVHPLPGIVDSFTINTAITLPVGVEAYGAYALGAWLTPGTPGTARTFARNSAIGALALGMLGQVVYHLLAAAHRTRAPWPVVVLVACLPVITLGFGAALTHLLRSDTADTPVAAPEIGQHLADLAALDRNVRADLEASPDATGAVIEPVTVEALNGHRKAVLAKYGDAIEAGVIPSQRDIMRTLKVGLPKAKHIQLAIKNTVGAK